VPSSKLPQPAKAPESISTSSETQPDGAPGTPPDFLVVARVLSAHGIRGELKCRIITDFPSRRFKRGLSVTIRGQAHLIEAARVQGDIVLLKLDDIADRTAAEPLRGAEVEVPADAALRLPRGQFYWHQVIGLEVQDVTTNEVLGRVADILETGANDVYVVKTAAGKEILVPAIKDVVKQIDPEAGRMLIQPLPGLLPS
jgi:16S rRNA processing protein RimM